MSPTLFFYVHILLFTLLSLKQENYLMERMSLQLVGVAWVEFETTITVPSGHTSLTTFSILMLYAWVNH